MSDELIDVYDNGEGGSIAPHKIYEDTNAEQNKDEKNGSDDEDVS